MGREDEWIDRQDQGGLGRIIPRRSFSPRQNVWPRSEATALTSTANRGGERSSLVGSSERRGSTLPWVRITASALFEVIVHDIIGSEIVRTRFVFGAERRTSVRDCDAHER